jgi:hypothetical protein
MKPGLWAPGFGLSVRLGTVDGSPRVAIYCSGPKLEPSSAEWSPA